MTFEILNENGGAVETSAERINALHAEISNHMTLAVKKWVEMGQLLTEQKKRLPHGEWIPWIQSNLVFNERQAQKYMRTYTNRSSYLIDNLIDSATSLNQAVALLAEPREEAEQKKLEPAIREVVYEPDPEQAKQLKRSEEIIRSQEQIIRQASQQTQETELELRRLKAERDQVHRELQEQREELQRLRKIEADEQKIRKTLEDIHELEKRKTEMFKDAESTRIVHQTLARSREFFTREVMQIAALHIRPAAVDAMQNDFRGLIDLVQNWLDAMKERFINE